MFSARDLANNHDQSINQSIYDQTMYVDDGIEFMRLIKNKVLSLVMICEFHLFYFEFRLRKIQTLQMITWKLNE